MQRILSHFLWILLLIQPILANLTSGTGEINFDTNSDDQVELKFNTTGLAIGRNLTPSANLHVSGHKVVTGTMSIGSTSSSSTNLTINGSMGMSFQTVSSDVTLGDHSLIFAGNASGNVTITLPEASSVSGRFYHIKKIIASNNVSIIGGGNVENYTGLLLGSETLGFAKLVSASGNWWILSSAAGVSRFHSDLEPTLLFSEDFEDTALFVNWGTANVDVASENVTYITGRDAASRPNIAGGPSGDHGGVRSGRDNPQSSIETNAGLLTLSSGGYSQITIEFSLYFLQPNAYTSPFLRLQYSENGTFSDNIDLAVLDPVAPYGTDTWNIGETITITDGVEVNFSDTAKVRWYCTSNNKNNHAYLDDWTIMGVP